MPRASYLTYLLVSALMVASLVPSQAITCNTLSPLEIENTGRVVIPVIKDTVNCPNGQCTQCLSAKMSAMCRVPSDPNVTGGQALVYSWSDSWYGVGVTAEACPTAASLKALQEKEMGFGVKCVYEVSNVACCKSDDCNKGGEPLVLHLLGNFPTTCNL